MRAAPRYRSDLTPGLPARPHRGPVLPLLIALLAPLAPAAEPSETWRTIETEHFRMHYPLSAEAWALQAAARLEAMRARVEEQVGLTLDRKVTIVVRDPVADSNGMALPFVRRPRTELWVTPPGAASPIGWNRRWDEGLIVHEDTHLVHLAQPARGGFDALLDRITGVGPIARKAPRWVIEGYATVVEGDQTGFGRPFAASEAALIRRLATEGRLPTYEELNGSGRWRGFSYAYGIGNAYLRWLREREGPDSLRDLWRRLTAVRNRSFDEAFEGVFGDSPEVLYGRFVAETTASAMALEAERPPRDGTRFLDLEEYTGPPALSPSGERLAVVVTRADRPVLAVWGTTPDPKAQEAWDQDVERLLERDPLDVPAERPPEPALGSPAVRSRRDRPPSDPQWIDDDTVLFSARTADRTGRLRRDLYAWTPASGQERRITRWQDVRDPSPVPGGQEAIAVHQSWGQSCLARVDLQDGAVSCLIPARVDTILDDPRVHPDGDRVLWLQQREGPWELWTAPLGPDGLGEASRVPVPEGAQLSGPAWHPDGERIVVSLGLPQLQEIAALDPATGQAELWTRSHGGATAPAVGEAFVYWRDEDAEGLDLHRAPLPGTEGAAPAEAVPPVPPDLPLGTVPSAPVVALPQPVQVEARPYGLGRQEARAVVGTQVSTDEVRLVAGVRIGDLVGRHETLLLGGWARPDTPADDDPNLFGLRTATALRSLPVDVLVDAWLTQDPRTRDVHLGGGASLQDWHRFPAGVVAGQAGGLASVGLGDAPERYAGHAALAGSVWEPTGQWVGLDAVASSTVGLLDAKQPGGWTMGRARLHALRRSLSVGARFDTALGGAPDLALGGFADPLLPDAWQGDRIWEPALPLAVATGRTHLQLEGELGGGGAGLWASRHLIGDGLDWGSGTTLVGLRARGALPAQPLAGVPRALADLGVACQVEDPITGVPDKVCRRLDHWTVWLGVRWRVD